MISRLTASAVCFAVLSVATLTFAAVGRHAEPMRPAAVAAPAAAVQLAPVLVIGRRAER